MMKSSNMSEKNGAASSSGIQASPAVGAKCVKSSGSSLSTERDEKIEKKKIRTVERRGKK
jgi:hypothetical protein